MYLTLEEFLIIESWENYLEVVLEYNFWKTNIIWMIVNSKIFLKNYVWIVY